MPIWHVSTSPWNLGIAMARRYLGRRAAGKHDWLAMVPTGHQYGRYISDLAGFDPVTRNNTEEGVVKAIMTWLGTRVDAADTLNPQQVLKGTPQFSGDMRLRRRTWGQWPPWENAAKAPGNYLDHGLHPPFFHPAAPAQNATCPPPGSPLDPDSSRAVR